MEEPWPDPSLTSMSNRSMPNADAAWLHMDRPTNRMVINAVLWFDAPVAADGLRRVLGERIVDRFPSFRQRAVERGPLGGAAWEDDPDFDLDLHFHHLALPSPGDRRALQTLVGDLASTPLTREKPLWDAYLIDGYGSGSAVVLRMHHCIADGLALAEVLRSITDDAAPRATPERPEGGPLDLLGPLAPLARTAWAVGNGVAREAGELLTDPRRLRMLAGEAVADARALAGLLLSSTDPQTPIHGDLGRVERVAWTEPFPLRQIKAVAASHEATINDVLVAAVAGALRRYLGARATPGEAIHAMVPFNLRLPDAPVPPQLGNNFGLVLLALPVEVSDPAHRVRAVHARMAEIKRSRQGPVSYGVLGAIGVAPVAVEDRVMELFSSKASLVLTNVPGPREPVRIAGVPVGGVLVWAPCAGAVSMSVSIFSYAGQVTVGFLVDAGLVPDPDELVDELQQEIAALTSMYNSSTKGTGAVR
jgi:diacylglycerol O-acyltransferase